MADKADDPVIDSEELVHLARLALEGRTEDVAQLARRLSRRLRHTRPALSDELGELLEKATSLRGMGNPMRRMSPRPTAPVDLDTRFDLLRVETDIDLPATPILSPSVQQGLAQIVNERRATSALRAAGLTPTRTALFYGPPGVGKTLAARWLAKELRRPLMILDLATVMSSFLGRTASNIRSVTSYAKEVGGILLLDEFDSLAKRRDDLQEVGELKRLVTALLQEIDDWPADGLLLGATNHPELLDPAAWRRFEVQLQFDLPDAAARSTAVRAFAGESKNMNAGMVTALTALFDGSSFAEIERHLALARRASVIDDQPLTEKLSSLISTLAQRLTAKQRIAVARSLVEAGLSQRSVHEMTGVSRDTMRKHQRGSVD